MRREERRREECRDNPRRNPPQVRHIELYEMFMGFLEVPIGAVPPDEGDDRD